MLLLLPAHSLTWSRVSCQKGNVLKVIRADNLKRAAAVELLTSADAENISASLRILSAEFVFRLAG